MRRRFLWPTQRWKEREREKKHTRALTRPLSPPLPSPLQPTTAAPACAWASLYTIAADESAQKSAAMAMALEDDPDAPSARPPGVVTVRTSVRPTAGCALADSPDPPTLAQAAALPRVPLAMKDSLAPLPSDDDEPVDAAADGKTTGGAAPHAPTRQQFAGGPPGPIPYNNLIVWNNYTVKVAVVVAGLEFTRPGYFPGVPATTQADRWAVKGWFWVEAGKQVLVFSTRANKAWWYAQTDTASKVWGGNNATGVAVYPDDVPFSSAAGGYASPYASTAPPTPVIHP